jgi:hypothetical protein
MENDEDLDGRADECSFAGERGQEACRRLAVADEVARMMLAEETAKMPLRSLIKGLEAVTEGVAAFGAWAKTQEARADFATAEGGLSVGEMALDLAEWMRSRGQLFERGRRRCEKACEISKPLRSPGRPRRQVRKAWLRAEECEGKYVEG